MLLLLQMFKNLMQAFKLLAEAPGPPASAGMDLLNRHRVTPEAQVCNMVHNAVAHPCNGILTQACLVPFRDCLAMPMQAHTSGRRHSMPGIVYRCNARKC